MIKYKKSHIDAKLPSKANKSDAGFDLWSVDDGIVSYDTDGFIKYIEYGIGIHIEPMPYTFTMIYPRSSIRSRDLSLANSVGIIDNEYRGELKIVFRPTKQVKDRNDLSLYSKGERIAQIIPFRYSNEFYFVETTELNETSRGEGGFGSTGST